MKLVKSNKTDCKDCHEYVYYYDGQGSPEKGLIKHINKQANIAYVLYGEIAMMNPDNATAVPTDLDELYVKADNGNFVKFKYK